MDTNTPRIVTMTSYKDPVGNTNPKCYYILTLSMSGDLTDEKVVCSNYCRHLMTPQAVATCISKNMDKTENRFLEMPTPGGEYTVASVIKDVPYEWYCCKCQSKAEGSIMSSSGFSPMHRCSTGTFHIHCTECMDKSMELYGYNYMNLTFRAEGTTKYRIVYAAMDKLYNLHNNVVAAKDSILSTVGMTSKGKTLASDLKMSEAGSQHTTGSWPQPCPPYQLEPPDDHVQGDGVVPRSRCGSSPRSTVMGEVLSESGTELGSKPTLKSVIMSAISGMYDEIDKLDIDVTDEDMSDIMRVISHDPDLEHYRGSGHRRRHGSTSKRSA